MNPSDIILNYNHIKLICENNRIYWTEFHGIISDEFIYQFYRNNRIYRKTSKILKRLYMR